jgi:hypothetical protein
VVHLGACFRVLIWNDPNRGVACVVVDE